jgi:putative DNA primase/helicase
MVSAVAALYEPDGVPAGGILVLQGEQYLGKTNWFNNLVSDHVKDCIKSGISIDPSDRDSKRTALSYWLVELGELIGSLQKKTQDPMKAFLTSNTDVFRLPYARADSRFKRRTVFCGTVNELKFLRDHTGNRRFFTIACQRINHTHGLDMQQIWAETKVLYDTGEKWFLSKEEFEELNVQNEEHELIDPLREKIDVLYEWEKYNPDDTSNRRLTATQVLEEMGYRNPSRGLTTSLGSILSTRIPTTGTKKLNGSRTYYMPALKNNPIADLWDRT